MNKAKELRDPLLDTNPNIDNPLIDDNNKSKLNVVIFAVIVTSMFQSLTGYGLSGSLNLFLTRELNESKATASVNTSLFVGARYFFTLLGAMVADKLLGRFKTILISIFIYLIAIGGVNTVAILVTIENDPDHVTSIYYLLFYVSLYIVAVGGSGMGTNIATFGAEQFSLFEANKIKRKKESFFQWRYFAVNCGSLIAYTVVAYLCQNVNFGVGYSVPTGSLILCAICFILPSKYYLHAKSVPKKMVKQQTSFCSICMYMVCCKTRKLAQFSSNDIDNVRAVLKVIPVVLCYIIYWSVWTQFATLIYAQGCQMNYSFHNWEFPIASLNIFRIIVVLILIPVFDRCMFPVLRTKYAFQITTMQKMGFGFLFAILSMIAAGFLEIYRKKASINNLLKSTCDDDDDIFVSNISIFWQVPVFALEGISEVLTSTTGYEFFFNEAPKSMKSIMTSLFTITVGLGSWLTGLYVVMVNNVDPNNQWITNNLNDGHLDWYFFMVAGIAFISFMSFICIATTYKYRDDTCIDDKQRDSVTELSDVQ